MLMVDVDTLTVLQWELSLGLGRAGKTVQKMGNKNEQKMIIFAEASAWFNF